MTWVYLCSSSPKQGRSAAGAVARNPRSANPKLPFSPFSKEITMTNSLVSDSHMFAMAACHQWPSSPPLWFSESALSSARGRWSGRMEKHYWFVALDLLRLSGCRQCFPGIGCAPRDYHRCPAWTMMS